MTLQSRLIADTKRIIGGDDMSELTLFNAAGVSFTAKGRITQPGMDFNPQGQAVMSEKRTIAFIISEYPTITGANEKYEGWQGEFLNSEGETIQGRFTQTFVNKTFGYVVTTLTKNKSGVSF